ncbi:glutathione ABC transporter substrate-binding protein [Alkalicoccus daliensis]|uniref:Peptide/nickel transport system substrate-binding protein n=1 Tax=Alkalicoccus daliensis TaxID=745820 RepID=A0A1H0K7R7_9BACI|nr:glutathione ABC transporter substrate-binding protein [Alkalicoccus daliensis]SDO51946.1 peptide/nickel transport system substrate-binding protein [Alkalicoccus daliensis]
MLRSKSLKAAVISAAVALTFTACASEPDNNGGGDNAPANDNNAEVNDGNADNTNTNNEGEGGEASDEDADPSNLVIATLSDANSLDPHGSNDVPSSAVQHNIFETLISQNEEAELEPLLATEWEATEDNVWTVQLREDVTFHDGSDFTADDVKATFDRVLDEDVASERAFLYEMVEEVVVVDDYTVEFHTEYPFAPFPSHLAHTGGSIMSAEVIEEDYAAMEDGGQPGDYLNENPIGTSFFQFEEWSPGTEIVLSRNDDYWGDTAGVEQVTFRVSPEGLTRIGELETGAADIIYPVSPSDTSRIEETDGIHMYEQESLSLAYIGFNMQKEPLDDQQVRQALSMAINKDDLIEGVYEGAATPAVGPIGEQVFGFSDEIDALDYDPERAQELLAEAGYEDGFDTTIWTNDSDERIAVAELVQAQLSVIGVNAEIEVLEWGAYLDNTAAGEHDMFILGWVTVTADADYGMYALFHSEQQGAAGNRSFMDNAELDEILDEARREPDEATREDLYEQAMEILVEEAPMLYLYHTDYLVGVRDEVEGFWKHPNGIYQLRDVTIEQ